jgi:pantetheine-phosphate adenylyltransferase
MTLSPSIAVYPGTFDPITSGHLDILERSLAVFDTVVVTIAPNIRKNPLFSTDERIQFIRDALPQYGDRLEFSVFEGLLVDFCRERGARCIVRGLRALADFEYEFQFAHMNRHLASDVETVFLMTSDESFYVSSSLVKEVATMGGDVSRIAPPAVVQALKKKLKTLNPQTKSGKHP